MTQYRTSLAAGRFLAEPRVPELEPRFEFYFSGPARIDQPHNYPGKSTGPNDVAEFDDNFRGDYNYSETSRIDTAGNVRTRGGAHRLPAPPMALRGRAAMVAMAAGAVVAAGQAGLVSRDIANTAATEASGPDTATSGGPQVLDVPRSMAPDQFNDVLKTGREFAQERAQHEADLMRPKYVKFAHGVFTSGFGVRWGVMHQGVDVAAPIGTPIYAVADGKVISAGPASGFGMWVRLQHTDGTITVYGHVNTATVSVGQHVRAGDQIATVGNRGYSTGPHCHFEVWQNGTTKIDPLPWLNARGINLGPEED